MELKTTAQLTTTLQTSDLQSVLNAPNFNALRSLKPEFDGQIINLTSYNGTNLFDTKGGGKFVGYLVAGKDDGGMTAAGTGFHWRRVVSNFATEINITHFGAACDGTTDDLPAVLRMYNYTRDSDPVNKIMRRVGIIFPAGRTFLSPYNYGTAEIDFLLFMGPETPYGLAPQAEIVSDKSDNPVITASARRTVIRGIQWNGQATGKVSDGVVSDVTNRQPFYKNVETAGQYVHVSSFYDIKSGGTVFDLLDTLDTKFEQVYSKDSFGNFLNCLWSNDPQGKWDHATAVELASINIQNNWGDYVFNMPRCTQSIIRNVWVEHSNCAGNFENSGIDIQQFSMEGCRLPANFKSCRGIHQQIQLQAGSSIVRGDSDNKWLSAYEDGYIGMTPQHTTFMQSTRTLWTAGIIRARNNTPSSRKWLRVGRFRSAVVGQIWELEFLGRKGYTQASGTKFNTTGEPGRSVLKIQRGSGALPVTTLRHEGQNGITRVIYTPSFNDWAEVWVELGEDCAEMSLFVKSTGMTKSDTGEPGQFIVDGTEYVAPPATFANNVWTSTDETDTRKWYEALALFSMHNGQAGFGAKDDRAMLATRKGTPTTTTAPAGYMEVLDNTGAAVFVPYYK